MDGQTEEDFNPFDPPPPDNAGEKRRLLRAITLSRGFSLLFACCNPASRRRRLMEEVQTALADRQIVLLPLTEPIPHLLHHLEAVLPTPPEGGAVMVTGLENWLGSTEEAQNSLFVANLNASRNSFGRFLPCPLVFWVSEFILHGIQHGAPDFFSVRSGIYFFTGSEDEPQFQTTSGDISGNSEYTAILGLTIEEKQQRLEELTTLLEEMESLPEAKRDPLAEARLQSSIGLLQMAMGDYRAAEVPLKNALGIRERVLGREHPSTATTLNNLAALYEAQGKLAEAEPLYVRALGIWERVLGEEHPDTAGTLNNLAGLFQDQGRLSEAEPLLVRALGIRERVLGGEHPSTATTLNNLAGLYEAQGKLAEAEPLLVRALGIRERVLGREHPDTAQSLNNLALLYEAMAREYGKKAADLRKRLG